MALTPREQEDLLRRVKTLEREVNDLREWRATARGVMIVLGFLGGLVAGAIVAAVIRAVWG